MLYIHTPLSILAHTQTQREFGAGVRGEGKQLSTTMVRKLFTWCYGGHQVFLCGSFSGWANHEPMIMAEGSSMIFQTVCDLPPGCHQYKFLVDGVWRVDDQQLCVQDEYGIINNLIVVPEPTLCPEAFRPTMDIDNIGIMQHAASSSGVHNEPVLQLSNNVIDVSRHHLSVHLSFYKIYELIPNSGKVFALDVTVAVKEAFCLMYEEGLAVVPLWDEYSRQILGMLTASDFILILIELHKNQAMVTDERLEMHTISSWKEGKFQLHRESVGATQPPSRRPLIQAGPDESLKDVALRILQNKISSVPVLHSTQDGSCPQLLHVVCLAGILKHICRHFRHRLEYLPLLQQPVGSLPLGTWTREVGRANGRLLLTLRPSNLLSSALNLLIEAQISSIPIVDDKGALINVFSRSDITSLAKGSVYTRMQLDQTIISQVLEVVDEATHQYHTCTRSDSLYSVMELLSNPAVRRLVVTEAGSQHVEGIITLRDVFNFILI